MATNLELYQELIAKIASAKAERDKLYNSLYKVDQPGGSWLNAVTNECGKAYDQSIINKTILDQLATYPKGTEACKSVLNIMKTRIQAIAKYDLDITTWQNQANNLLKDPKLQQDIEDQEANRKFRNNVIIVVIVIIVLIIAFFLYRKYKK